MLAVEHALQDILKAKSRYLHVDKHILAGQELSTVLSALQTQSDMLTHSDRGLQLPLRSSDTGESPSTVPCRGFNWRDVADYHSALVATQSDPKTQRALQISQTLLRNRFRHPTKMGDSRSHILQDMEFLLNSWSDHTDDMRYSEIEAKRQDPGLFKSCLSCTRESQEARAWWEEEAMFHKRRAMDRAKLYVGAKKALEALVPDEADCEGKGYQITSDS